ncbi:hypothetical protein ACKI10_43260 [Streptomyces galilaeus]|uniref:Uncharacterized protein n=1 Tax=Streptomyces galilaeus TaxID=33899 RepID=A0ABW9IYG1_STRGJ
MNDCPPTAFCPDHPVDPGLLVLIAVALIAIALFATAAVLLVVTLDTATRYIRRRLTRTRRTAAAYAAAITRVRDSHTRRPDGTCAHCCVTWPCPTLCLLAGAPCGPGCEDRHGTPPDPAPPRPHRDVMAAAVEDWWLTTDPVQDRDTGAEVAAHVEMYLHGSGYRITPWPHTPGPSRARTRLRSRAR